MIRSTRIITGIIFCQILICSINITRAATINGNIRNRDSRPVRGAVIYALDPRHRLRINNNSIMISENIPRAITDANGNFIINSRADSDCQLFVRDMQDNAILTGPVKVDEQIKITMRPSAQLTGTLLKGKTPVIGHEITAMLLLETRVLSCRYITLTDQRGRFTFNQLIPGKYLVQTIHEVPQVGCSFRSVVTKQRQVELPAAGREKIQLGGTNLPYLQGKITNTQGEGLHGVWVRLTGSGSDKIQTDSCKFPTQNVWSDVTARDGSYAIYDIPPGNYNLHCFRRLALNNYRRTLQADIDVIIKSDPVGPISTPVRNTRDVTIDLTPFMPLAYDQSAPPLSAMFLTGQPFNLAQQRGKVVVLHFYAGWCSRCSGSIGFYDKLTKMFTPDKLVVLGINLDNDLETCREVVAQKNLAHPQIFAGPWAQSQIIKDFHISDVPSTVIIDQLGKVSQQDLFNDVLIAHIKELLEYD